MYKKTLISIFTLALIVPFVASAAGFSDHWFNWLKKDQAAQVVKFSANIQDQTFARGDRDDSIKEIQEALSDMGIYKGWISGALGPKTEEAIATFQNQNGLELTGKLDKKTYDAIVNGVLKDNNSRGGGSQTQTTASEAPTLSYLQGRCGPQNPAFVRIVSPWQGDVYVQGQDDIPVEIFVCDYNGGTSHQVGLITQDFDLVNNAAIGPANIVEIYDDSDMTPYQNNTWIISDTLPSLNFAPGGHDFFFGSSGYSIDGIPQSGNNVYSHSGGFEVVGGGQQNDLCSSDPNPVKLIMTGLDSNGGAGVGAGFPLENGMMKKTLNRLVLYSTCPLIIDSFEVGNTDLFTSFGFDHYYIHDGHQVTNGGIATGPILGELLIDHNSNAFGGVIDLDIPIILTPNVPKTITISGDVISSGTLPEDRVFQLCAFGPGSSLKDANGNLISQLPANSMPTTILGRYTCGPMFKFNTESLN